jgi:hypothetical protein
MASAAPIIQRMEAPVHKCGCGREFTTAHGLAIHRAQWCKFGAGNKSDEPSDLSEDSYSDDEREFKRRGGRSKAVIAAYVDNKHSGFRVNTQEGLSSAVNKMDTAKNASANTHVLIGSKQDTYRSYSIGTATAVSMYGGRFSVQSEPNVHATWGKKMHVHSEMHALYKITGGDASKIKGCLKGKKIVVDKEICADCYPFVLASEPDEIRDGTVGKPTDQRERWDDWKNPFEK